MVDDFIFFKHVKEMFSCGFSESCLYVHLSVFSLQEFLDLQLRGWEHQYFTLRRNCGEKNGERESRKLKNTGF